MFGEALGANFDATVGWADAGIKAQQINEATAMQRIKPLCEPRQIAGIVFILYFHSAFRTSTFGIPVSTGLNFSPEGVLLRPTACTF